MSVNGIDVSRPDPERSCLPSTSMGREHYGFKYNEKARFVSYWHQIDEVRKLEAKRVLEVGTGSGLTAFALRSAGIECITLDVDPSLNPDILGSVLDIPLPADSVDVSLCCQVLEHLPFEQLSQALGQLVRVASRGLVVSLPDQERYAKVCLATSSRRPVYRLWEVARSSRNRPSLIDPQHCWEIGAGTIGLEDVRQQFRIVTGVEPSTYRVFEFPYHRFFVVDLHSKAPAGPGHH